ncbi:hypothetical protein PRIEUP_LOCUS921, partial [Pristimantis euphronides]
MEKDQKEIAEIVLNAALEIVYLLTGEDYTVMKKTSGVTPIIHLQKAGEWSRTPGPLNKKKILDLTKKMAELLTGEVPIRCQDVAIYFSMEEWEYIGEHQDLYKDHMLEDPRDLISTDGSRRRIPPERCSRPLCSQDCPEKNTNVPEKKQGENVFDFKCEVKDEAEETDIRADHQHGSRRRIAPERCPRPLSSQDCPEEEPNVPEDHQVAAAEPCTISELGDVGLFGPRLFSLQYWAKLLQMTAWGEDPDDIKVKIEDEWMMGSYRCKSEVDEGTSVDVTVETLTKNSAGNVLLLQNSKVEGEVIVQHSAGENVATFNVRPGFHTADVSCNTYNDEQPSPDQSQTITPSTGLKGDKMIQCGYPYTKSSGVSTPKRIRSGVKPYSCSECGKCFRDKSSLVRHERIHTGEKPFSCSLCGKCFSDKSSLIRHERIHTGEKPFLCSLCGRCFTNQSHLVKHVRIHTGEKPYSCSLCGKCFTDRSSYVIHMRIHKGEKPYSCSECGKCFTDKSSLVIHQRIHTGEKPYSCSECGKCFTDKSNLVMHLRIHTGEKPYACSLCGRAFTNKSSLVKHERSHTGEKPYSCSECGKCFTDKSSLVIHQRIHTDEKPYSCSECGKCFITKGKLRDHQTSHTGD